jgi:hypothetical protein
MMPETRQSLLTIYNEDYVSRVGECQNNQGYDPCTRFAETVLLSKARNKLPAIDLPGEDGSTMSEGEIDY